MKKFFIVLGVVVIAVLFITIFQNLIIKSIVTNVSSNILGAPVQIESFSLNIFNSTIHITGFKLYNPTSFPEGMLVSCPKINIVFDRASLFTHRFHFLRIDITLKEMVLTKNKEGKLNVDALKIVLQSKSFPPTPMQTDLLNLSIGKIVYENYTIDTASPSVRVFDVNKQQSYKGIPTVQQLAVLVLSEPMKSAAIKDAEIYGVAMLTGAAILPVAVAITFAGKDSVKQIIDASIEHLYKVSLEVIKKMGMVTKYDPSKWTIKANINGSMVAIILRKNADNKTEITISARKYMLPQKDIAGGVLYKILDKI